METLKSRVPIPKKKLLEILPDDYRSYYALAPFSESAQASSTSPTIDPEKGDYGPRYIGFGRNRSLIIAMNGDPQDPALEAIETDPKTGVPVKKTKNSLLT